LDRIFLSWAGLAPLQLQPLNFIEEDAIWAYLDVTIVGGFTLTWSASHSAGSALMAAVAPASTCAFHPSTVVRITFQFGAITIAMQVRAGALISVANWRLRAVCGHGEPLTVPLQDVAARTGAVFEAASKTKSERQSVPSARSLSSHTGTCGVI
jgi:hypothetical protein